MKLIKKSIYIVITVLGMALILQGCSFTINAGYYRNDENKIEESAPLYDAEQLEAEVDKLIALLEGATVREEVSEALKSFYDASSLDLSIVFFANSEGDIYTYPEVSLPEGYDARTRPWYKAALEQEVYISEFYVDGPGSTMVNVSKRLQKNGVIIGVASMDLFIK